MGDTENKRQRLRGNKLYKAILDFEYSSFCAGDVQVAALLCGVATHFLQGLNSCHGENSVSF